MTHTQPTFDRPCLPSVSQGQPRVGHCKECGISLNSTHGFPLTLYSVISWNHILCSIRSNCSSVITPTLSEETFHVLSLPINPYPKKDFRICYAAMICHLMGTQHRVMDFFIFLCKPPAHLSGGRAEFKRWLMHSLFYSEQSSGSQDTSHWLSVHLRSTLNCQSL